jgi:hypothetical protein
MAYKVQIADANLRGSITAPKDVDITVDLEASVIVATDDATLANGSATVTTGKINITDSVVQYKSNAASGDKFIEMKHSSQDPSIKLHDTASNHEDLVIDINGNAGRIRAADGNIVLGTLAASNGSFVGVDTHISGNLNVRAIALADCNIRVTGTPSTVTSVASVKDDIIVLGKGSGGAQADMDQAGLFFGRDNLGVNTDGGCGLVYRTSGTKFQVINLRSTAGDKKYAIKAKRFYGDGSDLDKFSFNGFSSTLIEPASALTTNLEAADITKIFIASFDGSQQVNLPAAGDLASGDFFVFKNGRAAGSQIILKTDSSQTIDGTNCTSGNITITDDDASFRIFSDGANYFME